MKGDFSRFTFDRRKHYADVRLQQGRVQLDADWNEQGDIAAYQRHTLATDLIGRTGAPEIGGGFGIEVAGNTLQITPGRYYVDGLLCENEDNVPIDGQPDLPGTPLPTAPGSYLAYLDVWQRSVTALEDPDLFELALNGADTATRLRTVWQVKLFSVTAGQTSFPPGWEPDTSPRPTLKVRAGGAVTENQLYRIEVHDPGALGTATFKWSQDNGSVAALIDDPANSDHIQITSQIGPDQAGGFETDHWIEVTDETNLLQGQPGILAKLSSVAGQVLQVEEWPAPGSPPNLPNHPQIRRWDSEGAPIAQVPSTNGGFIDLDANLEVSFAGSENAYFRTGDYWVVPVRAGAGVLWPTDGSGAPLALPPHGVQHHYAPLYVLQLSGGTWSVTEPPYRQVFQGMADVGEKLNRTKDDTMTASLTITGDLTVNKKVTVGVVGTLGEGLELLGGPLVLAQGSGTGYGLRFASSGSFLREDTNKLTLGVQGGSGSLGLSQAGSERLTITSTGQVGIRTTAPQQDVHIEGDVILLQPVTGVTISGNLTAQNEVTVGQDNATGGKLTLRQAPLVLATGDSSERGLLFPSLNGAAAFLRYDNPGNAPRLALAADSPATLALRQGGVDQITLTGGRVGIRTITPQQDVHIVGDVLLQPNTGVTVEKALTVKTALTYQDGSQSAGRVLTSDAGGKATWQSIVVGPVFIPRYQVSTGGAVFPAPVDPPWTRAPLPSQFIPSGVRAVILEADVAKSTPDRDLGRPTDAFIWIRRTTTDQNPNILIRARAAGTEDFIALSNQGVFPVHTDNTFEYQVTGEAFEEWFIHIVGYFP